MALRDILLNIEGDELKTSSLFAGYEGDHLVTSLNLKNDGFDEYRVFFKFNNGTDKMYITDLLELKDGYYTFDIPQGLLKAGELLVQAEIKDHDNTLIRESGILKLVVGKSIVGKPEEIDKYVGLLDAAIKNFYDAIEEMKSKHYITADEAEGLIKSEMAVIIEQTLKDYVTKTVFDTELQKKQGKLTPGDNIEISEDGVISSTAEGTKDYEGLENQPKINDVTLTGNKTTDDLKLNTAKVLIDSGGDEYSIDEVVETMARIFELEGFEHYVIPKTASTIDKLPTENGFYYVYKNYSDPFLDMDIHDDHGMYVLIKDGCLVMLNAKGIYIDKNFEWKADSYDENKYITEMPSKSFIYTDSESGEDVIVPAGDLMSTLIELSQIIQGIVEELEGKQETLESGVNIKTINGNSILGEGNIEIKGGGKEYTPGDGINISDNDVISIDDEVVADKQYVDDKVAEVELYKFPNVTIIGEPDIQHGQISGFSTTDYLEFPFLVNFKRRTFEINMAFTTGSNVTTQENILDSIFGLAFAIKNSHFIMAVSTDGSSWNLGEKVGTLNVQPNTSYRVRITWNGILYKVEYSIDGGSTYTTDIQFAATQYPYPKQMYIGVGNIASTSQNFFSGIINLNYCNLSIGGELVWQGMDDVGLATRADVSLSNIDEAGVAVIEELAKALIDEEIGELEPIVDSIISTIGE